MSVLPEIFDFPLSLVRLAGGGADEEAGEGEAGREADLGTSNFVEDFWEVFGALDSFFSALGGSLIAGGCDFAASAGLSDVGEVDFGAAEEVAGLAESADAVDAAGFDAVDVAADDFGGSGVAVDGGLDEVDGLGEGDFALLFDAELSGVFAPSRGSSLIADSVSARFLRMPVFSLNLLNALSSRARVASSITSTSLKRSSFLNFAPINLAYATRVECPTSANAGLLSTSCFESEARPVWLTSMTARRKLWRDDCRRSCSALLPIGSVLTVPLRTIAFQSSFFLLRIKVEYWSLWKQSDYSNLHLRAGSLLDDIRNRAEHILRLLDLRQALTDEAFNDSNLEVL